MRSSITFTTRDATARGAAICSAVIALVLTACGDDPLARIGEVSREVVHEGTTTTLIVAPVEVEGFDTLRPSVRPVDSVVWINEGVTAETSADPLQVLALVWERGKDVSSGFVQATRAEISTVLPEVRFPDLVPTDVSHISSQLVFDPATGALDLSTSAAFGMWNTEPYSVSRQSGQLAVLRVGQNIDATIADFDISSEEVSDGLSLSWQQRGYTYELFCRNVLEAATCFEVANSLVPLRQLA